MKTKYLILNNGVKIPQMGFGTYLLHSSNAIYEAIKIGYRLIDTAEVYKNDDAMYDGVHQALQENLVTREQLFITSKVWMRKTKEEVLVECKRQLKALNLKYLDLMLLHWPSRNHYSNWEALEELYEQKLIRAIGVCNYAPQHFDDLLKNNIKIKPMLNQVELHPGLECHDIREYCKKNKILVQAWRSLIMHHLDKAKTNRIVQEIAQNHKATVSQVLLNWALSQNLLVIPKSKTPSRIKENFKTLNFCLNNDEVNLISKNLLIDRLGPKLDYWWEDPQKPLN